MGVKMTMERRTHLIFLLIVTLTLIIHAVKASHLLHELGELWVLLGMNSGFE